MPDAKLKVTKADLMLIDGAIAMHRASQIKVTPAMIGVDAASPTACDPVDVAALLVAAAIIAYKAWNSCLVGGESEQMRLAEKLKMDPHVSLQTLIAKRNVLAKQLNEPALHG
jgi:hypothetical protein